jgi:tRNA 2-thiouridine synthesizing protein E
MNAMDEVRFNQRGFLDRFDGWERTLAERLAREDGLELQENHWTVVEFARAYYRANGIPPSARVICHSIGAEIAPCGCTHRTLLQLFPQGGCKAACRIAGLPDYYLLDV